ncbi:hypothetical protein GCM10023324_69010 [Streptomyces youssoufiensis]
MTCGFIGRDLDFFCNQPLYPQPAEPRRGACAKTTNQDARNGHIVPPASLRWANQTVRLRELGGPGTHGGAPGDLYATMRIVD